MPRQVKHQEAGNHWIVHVHKAGCDPWSYQRSENPATLLFMRNRPEFFADARHNHEGHESGDHLGLTTWV